jgi:hypothetical protein
VVVQRQKRKPVFDDLVARSTSVGPFLLTSSLICARGVLTCAAAGGKCRQTALSELKCPRVRALCSPSLVCSLPTVYKQPLRIVCQLPSGPVVFAFSMNRSFYLDTSTVSPAGRRGAAGRVRLYDREETARLMNRMSGHRARRCSYLPL